MQMLTFLVTEPTVWRYLEALNLDAMCALQSCACVRAAAGDGGVRARESERLSLPTLGIFGRRVLTHVHTIRHSQLRVRCSHTWLLYHLHKYNGRAKSSCIRAA